MPLTRRNLLTASAAIAATATATALGLRSLRRLIPRVRHLATPPLPPSEPGPLAPELQKTLLAAVRTLVGDQPDLHPYERLIQARAASLHGYRELYHRFGQAADGRARAAGVGSFADAPPDLRRRILHQLAPAGPLTRLRAAATDPDRARFRLYLAREILELYAATGAWTALGFGRPPGEARGLDHYTRAPAEPTDGGRP